MTHKKKSAVTDVTAQKLQGIKTFLTVQLSKYPKGGSTSSKTSLSLK